MKRLFAKRSFVADQSFGDAGGYWPNSQSQFLVDGDHETFPPHDADQATFPDAADAKDAAFLHRSGTVGRRAAAAADDDFRTDSNRSLRRQC